MMAEFHKYPLISILLGIGIYCTSIFHPSQNSHNTPDLYQIAYNISDGLKAYANFTGKQFLIINHDSFDWENVTVAVKAMKDGSPVVVESVDRDEISFAFAVPRIKAGEARCIPYKSTNSPHRPLWQYKPCRRRQIL